jgi:hypothetical protein
MTAADLQHDLPTAATLRRFLPLQKEAMRRAEVHRREASERSDYAAWHVWHAEFEAARHLWAAAAELFNVLTDTAPPS